MNFPQPPQAHTAMAQHNLKIGLLTLARVIGWAWEPTWLPSPQGWPTPKRNPVSLLALVNGP